MDDMQFGLTVTLMGMGLVFSLLALLWLVLTLIGRIDTLPFVRRRREEAAGPGAAGRAGGLDPDLLTAITIAVAAHVEASRRQGSPSMRVTAPGSRIFASRWLAAGRARQTDSWTPKRG